MKHIRIKALNIVLMLMLMLGLMPGMDLTAYADESPMDFTNATEDGKGTGSKAALSEKEILFYMSIDDAVIDLNVMTLKHRTVEIVETCFSELLSTAGEEVPVVATDISTVVANEYKNYLTDNLKVSVSTTVRGSEAQYTPDGNGGQTLTGYETNWSILVTLQADDGETAILISLSDQVFNSSPNKKAIGDECTISKEMFGTKVAPSENVISNADGSVFFKKDISGKWTAYVRPGIGKTTYSYRMSQTTDDPDWYVAAAPSGSSSNKRKEAYDNNLKDKFITLDGNFKAMLKFSSKWSYDEDEHWHACIDDGYTDIKKDTSTHNWNDVVVTTEPTTVVKTYTCKDCGKTVVVAVDWNESASYTYNGSAQGPTVNKITVSAEPVKVPDDASNPKYYKENGAGWEVCTDEPEDPGSYKLSYQIDNNEVTIPFVILEPGKDKDYMVAYEVKIGEDSWSDVGEAGPVNAGEYKAVPMLRDFGYVYMEKKFKIKPIELTITAKDQTYYYNGTPQAPGHLDYEDNLDNYIEISGNLASGDKLVSIEIDGQASNVGTHNDELKPDAACIKNGSDIVVTGNYKIKYVNGNLVINPNVEVSTEPNASAITYGQTLASSDLTGGKAVDLGTSTEVEGTFAWKDNSIKPVVSDSNATEYDVVFTPTDTAHNTTAECKVKLTVNKAATEVSETPEAAAITYGNTLADSKLTGGKAIISGTSTEIEGTFAWKDCAVEPEVKDSNKTEYEVTFTPTDTASYEASTCKVKLTVNKAATEVNETPEAAAITCGKKLADSKLTGGKAVDLVTSTEVEGTFAWTDATIKPELKDSNNTEYEVTFTPTDTANYEASTCKVKLTVNKVSGTPVTDMKAGKTSMTIAWEKTEGVDGYDIFFSRCNHGDKKITLKNVKTISGNNTFVWKNSGLKKGTCYKAYVKAYVMIDGKKKYVKSSPLMHAYTGKGTKKYTNAKSVKVNKTRVSLSKGQTFKLKVKVKKLKKNKKLMPKKHVPRVRYLSTDTSIAKVSSKGKITGVKAGTCYVYAYAHNGVFKKITVTVK